MLALGSYVLFLDDRPVQPSKASAESAAPPRSKTRAPKPEPVRLFATDRSAYAAALALDDHGTYLMTSDAAYRLAPARNPERWPLDLGRAPALTTEQLLFWSRGELRQVKKGGGEPELLALVAREPQRLVTSGDRFAWLDRTDDRHYTVQTLDGVSSRVLYETDENVNVIAMFEDSVFFTAQEPRKDWRLGVVSLDGGPPRFTAKKKGRTPAMLVAQHDVFYYDGPSSTVRRVSPDLERERVVVQNVVCSPMAVAEHLYCAQPGGVREIGLDGVVRRVFPLKGGGLITALAASTTRLSWVIDIGPDQLAVDTITLDPGDQAR